MSRPRLHLVNALWSVGGSECRTVELYRLLSPHADVEVWSQYQPDPRIRAQIPVQRIDPWRLRFPRDGTVVFVGAYFRYGRWIHLSGIRRRIIIYNTDEPRVLRRRVRKLRSFGTHRVELVFCSRWLRDTTPYRGPVHVSPIDLQRFRPPTTPRPPGPFTVGRLSRDQPEKHNRRDPALYAALAADGVRVRVMGGGPLRALGPVDGRVELVPEGAEDAARFVQGLDCFFYRTADGWREPHGRVVQEAMACGLPVVCSREVGATELIRHGVNGLVFDGDEEALRHLRRLHADPALRARLGAAARRTVEHLFSEAVDRRVREFYLSGKEAELDPAAELEGLLAAEERARAVRTGSGAA